MQKVFIFLMSFFMLQGCVAQKKKVVINIEKASYQSWVAGIRGGGSGLNFTINLKSPVPQNIEFTKLYFKNKEAKSTKISDTEYRFAFVGEANFERDINQAVSDDPKPQNKVVTPPVKINEGEALLEYVQAGKKYFLKINKVEEKEMLAYPSARPQN